jgi:hypothetical protein
MNDEDGLDKNSFDEWEAGLDVLQEKTKGLFFTFFAEQEHQQGDN